MSVNDTIAAIATARGEGGVAIVRISGPRAREILRAVAPRRGYPPRTLCLSRIYDARGALVDEGLCVYMPAPRSYTREDVAELQLHGGRACAEAVLALALSHGARLAKPGEFTRRAFENGRIDLAQAEAVMSLIGASSKAAAAAAARQLDGGASRLIGGAREGIIELLSEIEAGNDFPDEVDELVERAEIARRAADMAATLERAADENYARSLRDGFSVALAGAPNAGKSSLMNRLLGWERAIVSPEAGTTRDVLTERLELDGIAFDISDTAGLREAGGAIEAAGVERAKRAASAAELVVLVLDASSPPSEDDEALLARYGANALIALNKLDLATSEARPRWRALVAGREACWVSAATGEGLDALLAAISRRAARADSEGDSRLAERRHVSLAAEAAALLRGAARAAAEGVPADVCAADLFAAADKLGEITGQTASEEVVSGIFARFCVGK